MEQRTGIRNPLSNAKEASETILGSQGAFQKGLSDARSAEALAPGLVSW